MLMVIDECQPIDTNALAKRLGSVRVKTAAVCSQMTRRGYIRMARKGCNGTYGFPALWKLTRKGRNVLSGWTRRRWTTQTV